MLHSLNSLTSLRSVYADSSEDPFDDPKVETIVEIFKRLTVRNSLP